jgi:phenylacetate-CoA ligase
MLGVERRRLPADSLTLDAFTKLIRGIPRPFRPGCPSAIAHFDGRLLEAGATLPTYPQTVITYVETLTPTNAMALSKALRCRVSNYYSTWDAPHIAQTCPDHPRLPHVASDRVVVRVVRADGAEADPGESGLVVVTDLSNHVMPFINYLIGDDAVAGGPCPCGRGFPTLATIEGRTTEVLRTPSGKQVSGIVLGNYLTFEVGVIPFVWEYQAIQQAPEAVTVRVVPTPRFTEPFGKRLREAVETFLGPGVAVSLELVERIAVEPSGKRLIIKPPTQKRT